MDTTGFYKILKDQLLKIVGNFINELDISFNYVDKDLLKSIKNKLKNMKDNDIKFKKLYKELHSVLKVYKESNSLNIGEKVKSKELVFLNDINLLGIPFCLFNNESKNTKRTIINYLCEFYLTSHFLMCITNDVNGDSEENMDILTEIQKMISELKKDEYEIKSKQKQTKDKSNFNINNEELKSILPPSMNNTFMELMQNKDIMNIASELSMEMQSQEIDPMSMMTSLMSGNLNDGKIGTLINSISTKLSNKIENGEIDKNALETHANSFMSTLASNKDLMKFSKEALGNLTG